jgi:hypothetical protein
MKQVFNKITEKFEMMQPCTAAELERKGKCDILADDAQNRCLVIREIEINGKKYRRDQEVNLSVVDAHKWEDHGYIKILGKPEKVEIKIEKVATENKTEPVVKEKKTRKPRK